MTSSTNKRILKIGSKGEIFPPKDIREKLGFEPDQPIILYIHNDQLIIRKIHSLEEILKTPPKVKISYHAWKQFKEELSEELEK
ncbi:MAG: hypothetical protein GF353_21240 [Candidatus Lokiarchaeota archaeon]|nr:hypothetical protein [Candidatus Lokiarchaeota archaeon]